MTNKIKIPKKNVRFKLTFDNYRDADNYVINIGKLTNLTDYEYEIRRNKNKTYTVLVKE